MKLIEIINTEANVLDADCFEIIANYWLCLWLVCIVGIGKELEDYTTGIHQLMNTQRTIWCMPHNCLSEAKALVELDACSSAAH